VVRRLTPDDLLAFGLAGEPQLSPDGRRLAYVVARIDREVNEYRHQIFVMEALPGARGAAFTAGTKSDRNPRWSPDGSRLAFLSNRSGKNQVWLIDACGGEARQLTRFKEGVSGPPVWSPDGSRIAFAATVGEKGPGKEGDKEEEADLFKKHTKGVKRITRLFHKEDGTGFFEPDQFDQLFFVEADAEEAAVPTQVTRGSWNHADPVWSPDGQALLFAANRRQDWDYTPQYRDLWVQDLSDLSGEPFQIRTENLHAGSAAWSPDGSQIAFVSAPVMPYPGYGSPGLWLVGRDGTGLRRLAEQWDRPFGSEAITDMPGPGGGRLRWTPDGEALVLLGSDSGRQQLYAVDSGSGSVSTLTSGEHCIYAWSFDRTCRKLAVALTRPDVPGDLFLVEGSDLFRLTSVNEKLLDEVELAPVEAFRFRTAEGSNAFVAQCGSEGLEESDGWVMKPAGFEEGKQYPAILEIHGGPMAMYGWTFFYEFQALAAAGYAVIYTNPRGSQGYGERFCACIRTDWGNLDYLDVMAGLDAALTHFPWIDASRLGVAGGSYGGFMTNWIVGHTDRFKAAVTMRSVVNEASSVGTSDFGFLDMATYPTTPWEEMGFYRRVSPLTFVANIQTPLLIEHQEQDYRCPIEQAEQLYTALKVLRRTVEFVRYPESSHGMSRTGKPWLRVHRLRTILDWFGRYIPH